MTILIARMPSNSTEITTNSSSMLFVLRYADFLEEIQSIIVKAGAEWWFGEPTIYHDALKFCEEYNYVAHNIANALDLWVGISDPWARNEEIYDISSRQRTCYAKLREYDSSESKDGLEDLRAELDELQDRKEEIREKIMDQNAIVLSEYLKDFVPFVVWETKEDNELSIDLARKIFDVIGLPRLRTS